MTTTAADDEYGDQFDVMQRLERAAKIAAADLTRDAARSLVDIYYRWQEHRIALNGQIHAQLQGADSAEPLGSVAVVEHFATQVSTLEKQMVAVLGTWAKSRPEGAWAQDQKGIGPVLSAGLGAHIDITRAPTVGHIWRFAGLDPTVKWEKKTKRPWNADLKVLCWRIGDSFVKVSGRDDAVYGKVYRERKQQELERDAAGLFADQAAETLASRNIKDAALKRTYESGHLPAGRLDLRARRYAVKLFLSHYHEVAYEAEFGESPPLPYPIAQLGHAHKIDPPR
jgi:hypothetical protein